MALSPNGRFVVSSGHDKTLRLWERSEEVLVLEDERETEREREGDEELATGDAKVIAGQDGEAALPTKKTVESEKGAERLMEAIEMYRKYNSDLAEHKAECEASGQHTAPPSLPLLMVAYQCKSADEYMTKMIELVKSSEIEQTLLVIPFDIIVNLIEIIEKLLDYNRSSEVICRMFFFVVEVHFGPLSSATSLHPLIERVKVKVEEKLTTLRDLVGFNLAATEFHLTALEEKHRVEEALEETVVRVKEKRRKKKNKEKAMQTAILTL